MRSIWTGAITFGLISIPVKLYTAVSDHRIDFDLLHAKDGAHIRYKRVSEKSGREVEWDDIVKGYEIEEGTYVTFTKEELKDLDVESLRVIDIDAFVDAEEIDPIYYEKTYYVEPREGGEKAYRLLAQTLEKQDRVAVAKFAMREKEHLCTLRISGNMIVLHTMHWPAEIRKPELKLPDARVKVSPKELKMAADLVDALAEPFEPTRYKNVFEQRVKAAARDKLKGKEIVQSEPEADSTPVADLMKMLEQSLTTARTGSLAKKRKELAKEDAEEDGNGKRSKGKGSDGDKPHTKSWFLDHTKDELLKMAAKEQVEGRSDMTKSELAEALAD